MNFGRNMETVICAAILLPDGYIIRGHRHTDCFRTLDNYPEDNEHRLALIQEINNTGSNNIKQGFVTSHNRFVDRKEGLKLQLNAGISSKRVYRDEELYSEDLY